MNNLGRIWPGAAMCAVCVLVATLARGAEPGSILWERQFGPDYYEVGAGVDVVAGGNIVVAGYQEDWIDWIDYGFVALFDRDGRALWRRRVAAGKRSQSLDAVAADVAGNVYAAGRSTFTDVHDPRYGDKLALLVKFDAAGNRQWLRLFGTGSEGQARGVVADDDGVLVVGSTYATERPSADDAFLVRFDANGRRLWTRWLRGDGYDYAYAVARDSAGHIIVVGTTQGIAPSPVHLDFAAFVAKYGADGRRLWCRELGRQGATSVAANGVASDAAGNIVIAGETTDEAGGVFAAKVDPDGRLLWTRQFGEPFGDVAFSVAVDGAGNSVLVGRADRGPVGGPRIGGGDTFVIKLDPEGGKMWGRQVGTPKWDWAAAVAIDAADDAVLVTGLTQGDFVRPVAGAGDGFLVRFAP